MDNETIFLKRTNLESWWEAYKNKSKNISTYFFFLSVISHKWLHSLSDKNNKYKFYCLLDLEVMLHIA